MTGTLVRRLVEQVMYISSGFRSDYSLDWLTRCTNRALEAGTLPFTSLRSSLSDDVALIPNG